MLGIIDYGMGNLRSVQKAFEHLDVPARILTDSSQILHVDRLVLPGVGAFADGMRQLRDRGWIEPIRQFIDYGRPFLGICLGMQLLFDDSMEDAREPGRPVAGLGVLPGQVRQFEGEAFGLGRLKVPHMGWNTVSSKRRDPLFMGLPDSCHVYFVHGFYALPGCVGSDLIASGWTEYGVTFCSSVWRGNLWATQFHPEKSQRQGLKMLSNFMAA